MESSMWIEGISNDVTIFFFVVFLLSLYALYASYRAVHTPSINAAAQENVEQIRQRISNQREDSKHRIESPRGNKEEANCPICLTSLSFAIETNCGHRFCASCFFEYYRRENTPQRPVVGWRFRPVAVRCPCCRRTVDAVHAFLTKLELRNENPPRGGDMDNKEDELNLTPAKVSELVTNYNKMFSNEPRTFRDMVLDTPTLLRHLWRQITSGGPGNTVLHLYLMTPMVILLLYVVFPLDIIPEAIFGILGFLDDLLIGFLLLVYLAHEYRRHRLPAA